MCVHYRERHALSKCVYRIRVSAVYPVYIHTLQVQVQLMSLRFLMLLLLSSTSFSFSVLHRCVEKEVTTLEHMATPMVA